MNYWLPWLAAPSEQPEERPTQVVPKPDPTKAEIGESLYDVRACGRCGVKLDRRKAKAIGKTHYCPKPCYQEEERDRAATAKFLSRVSLDKI